MANRLTNTDILHSLRAAIRNSVLSCKFWWVNFRYASIVMLPKLFSSAVRSGPNNFSLHTQWLTYDCWHVAYIVLTLTMLRPFLAVISTQRDGQNGQHRSKAYWRLLLCIPPANFRWSSVCCGHEFPSASRKLLRRDARR